ncbi:MAG: hypothetical protein ACKVOA_09090 [Methylophilaceae bacterium]
MRDLGAVKPQNLAVPTFTPPSYRWALGVVLGLETLLIFWALTHHFIPSSLWRNIAFYINIVLCALCTAYFAYSIWLNAQLYPSKIKKVLIVISAPILFYLWGYIALTFGVGDLFTNILGKPSMMEDIFTKNADDDERFKKEYLAKGEYEKRYFDNRKGCITRLNGVTLKDALPVYFCVSGQDFAILPKQVAVKIHGLQSVAGFDIEWIEYDWLKTSLLPTEQE